MPTYRLDITYDGRDFHGYARQPGLRTVEEVLEDALFRLTGRVETVVAGRTDAGVHASGQVVSFSSDRPLEPERVIRSLNKGLPDDVAALELAVADPEFDARFSANSRTYHYLVLNRPTPDPLLRHTSWHVPQPLDVSAMNAATGHLVGEHDFASFCRKVEGRSTVREVVAANWKPGSKGLLRYEITATAFCHQMVRSIVALCVEVGRGKLTATDVPAILEARDRNAARGAAPPHGLQLHHVDY